MGHKATRLCFQNWYLIGAIDIDIKGSTALVGPTGAGKSSIQDGVQTVMTGNNHNRLNLNPSASGKSARSVLDYCLGWTKDASEGGKPLREACESVIALVFVDPITNEPMTVGVALSARLGDSREEVLSRFIAPGYAYSVNHFKRRNGSKETLAPWSEIIEYMRQRSPGLEEFKASAEKFTAEMLRRMRTDGQPPNPRHFLRAFSNALAFKPIFDPTLFVRDFILEPDELDIERVRTSIATWQELERVIENIEARLRRVTRLSDRFRNWGRAKVRAEAAKFTAAAAELRRVGHEVRIYKDALGQKEEALASERSILKTRKQWVAEFEEEIRSKTILARTSGDAAFMRQVEIETQHADRELKAAEGRLHRIKKAFVDIVQLSPIKEALTPRQVRAIEAAREASNLLPEGAWAEDALKNKGERIQSLLDEVLAIESLDLFLHERADQLASEVRDLQAQIEEIESKVGHGSSNAMLSGKTMRLMQALERRGMAPVPICDVVDVKDEEWRYAVEALLGWGREALIVPPERVSEAWDIMEREKDIFAGCTLVATNDATLSRHRPQAGSIVEAISTDNPFAEAFVAVRIGGFIKAENEQALSRMDRGVTKSGKSKAGMGLSVTPNVRDFMLGRAARDKSSETLRNELAEKQKVMASKGNLMRLLREAARLIPASIDALRDGESPFDLEFTLKSLSGRLDDLRKSKTNAAGSSDAAALLDEITYAEEQRALYLTEIGEELEKSVFKLQHEVATATAKLDSALESFKKAFKDRKKAWISLSAPDVQKLLTLDAEIDEPNAGGMLRRIKSDFRREEKERSDLRSYFAGLRGAQKAVADEFEGEARREQSATIREIAEYSAAWDADTPQVDHDTMTTGYVWVMAERARLETNELRRHKQACERAANEMRKLLKEDLLARLAEKLVKVHHKLDMLNSLLSRHRFTGQTYTFTSSVNQRFQRMHDLAMKVAQADDQAVLNLEAHEIAEAVGELESLIQGNEGTQKLADYREYFMFEIIMTDKNGGRTSMSTRAVKGSGGEAQAPFYVAIAASLSSAYFPGHAVGEPTGMGLAMFDEAFNKLDVPNTQALLTFFRDMGLQLMIAGPEDKRATFTEVLDTIILVNKAPDGASVYIDAEYPGDLAKLSLGAINPDHGGVDAFRTLQ